ncbi:MAG: sulfatase-like hydrolase/transferase [Bacteroidales bacterium]|nr:sulfatase-like hydrolase/transferase [Bacteroidales bacterium]MCF8391415.1 sulfatase-like hydrolase/transferase [Bacteroidales bacterium]
MTKGIGKYNSDRNAHILLSVLIGFSTMSEELKAQEKPNILFIAVDDMNCDFGAYGNPVVKSPNLDALASDGVLFANNHCQKAVSGASRASLLSGFTPGHTGITGFYQYLRDLYPDVVTLPQFFKNNGYHTTGTGKIHDPRNVSLTDKVDLISWTEFVDITGNNYVDAPGNPVTESADVEDDGYTDGRIADEGLRQIRNLSNGPDPFFIAVGFKKPHLPFSAPKKYWDLYDRDSISLAPFRKYAENDLEFVHNPGDEFFNGYDNVPENGNYSADLQREYIHGYYACVSYIDTQIGKLINELKQQGVYDKTIIVMWGDHGFSLGDHTNWGKHTNFEYATRSPLLIKAPGMLKGKIIESPSEHLDIYPTLVDLAGFPIPDTLDGNSLVKILDGSTDKIKEFAVSQFTRGGKQGFSLRSDYFQFVEWKNDDVVDHIQLFDFVNDPYQTTNIFNTPKGAELADTFSIRLNNYQLTGENSSPIELISNTDSLGLYRNYYHVEFLLYEDYNNQITPLKDVQISLDVLNLPTSNKGFGALQLQPGHYNYSFTKENYSSKSGSLLLSADTLITDTLKRENINVLVNVVNDITGANISGAELSLGELSGITNLAGNVQFFLKPGNYDFFVSHVNYKPFHANMAFNIDTSFSLRLSPAFATIKFRLKNDFTPINNAFVFLNDSVELTNSLGLAYFYNQAVDSVYTFSAEKKNFDKRSGSFTLRTDTTIDIQLESSKYNLEFKITDELSGQNISGAQLLIGDSTGVSDDSGLIFFSDFPSGYYSYSISSENYQDYEGTVNLSCDTLLLAGLSWFVNISNSISETIQVYPNPSKDIITLNSDFPISNVRIYRISGKLAYSRSKVRKENFSVDISFLESGMYFIEIVTTQQSKTYKEILIKH